MDEQKLAFCPVCDMEVEIEGIGRIFKTNHSYETYYFCNDTCLKTFKKNPEEYVRKKNRKNREIS